MLTKLQVTGFKSVANAELELGLFNVFIGANGSGKSNLLEAIGVMGAACFGSIEPETLRYRGVRRSQSEIYKSSFSGAKFPAFIVLNGFGGRPKGGGEAHLKLGLDNVAASSNLRWRVHSESLLEQDERLLSRSPKGCRVRDSSGVETRISAPRKDEFLTKDVVRMRRDAKDARSLIEALEGFAIYSPTTEVLRGIVGDVGRAPVGLSGSNLPVAVQSLLNAETRMFGPFELDDVWELVDWAKDVHAVPSNQARVSSSIPTPQLVLQFTDKFMRSDRAMISAYDASEGALYVLFLLTMVVHPDAPKLFSVDNFDHALHPKLVARLTRMVSEQLVRDGTRQVIVTSHNPLVLDGLDLRNDKVRLFAVDRNRQGQSEVRRIEVSKELLAEAEHGMTLSRLWTQGRLGGVPTL